MTMMAGAGGFGRRRDVVQIVARHDATLGPGSGVIGGDGPAEEVGPLGADVRVEVRGGWGYNGRG